MLKWIGDLIQIIVDGINSLVDGVRYIVDYFTTLVEDIAWLSKYLGLIANQGLAGWFTWLPPLATTVILVCVVVAVVFKILGRE